ncbi:MAG: type IV pilus twitching motility protein PilT [Butyrivibrio sp.]|nr:type IV pilus twitching motility protein PilT [Muribaculum sp.]MCM1551959.1 type IV pilus twitching motility protein PilT [Butyrivibrio sp.]
MAYIEQILARGNELGASDVHLTVGLPPKMRVNGNLLTSEFPALTPADTLDLLVTVLNEHQRAIFEERGEFDMSFSVPGLGRYRVNAFKQRGTIAMAFRVVGTTVPSPEVLGVPDSVIDLYQRKRGLILVTGPTGSGKSTTLAAIIDKINSCRDAHIITLEDPIEYLHPHKLSMVNQREMGIDSQSYANALRAALREDPDVILVGEMRDFETISVAITAAETGHLVLSTLHTNSAASTVDRVIDVFPPHQQQQIRIQFANVLEAVITQSLIPTADGSGRVAAFEVMHANHAIRNLIREGKSHQLESTMQTNRKMGMITMDEAIGQLYLAGKIDREQAIHFAHDPDNMAKKI